MTEFVEGTIQRLEALKHDWRKWPVLVAAVNGVKDIVEQPEKYQCQSLFWKEEPPVLLANEVNSGHPLTTIVYLYDISTPEQKTADSHQRTFLQVSFSLCKRISTPQPEDFEPIVAIIHAPVHERAIDWLGVSGVGTSYRTELKLGKDLRGSRLLPHKAYATREIRKEILRLTDPSLASKPFLVEYYNWTGNRVDILPAN